ncbi:MAG TPA: hypothetical protein EYH42_04215 [Sulfurovum sp.]|nr:hypothetical protein [Sulfurovum sp.]
MTKIINVSLVALTSILFTACTSSAIPEPVQSPNFKEGSHDGCATAKGEYSKDSSSFNNNKDYQDGWYHGRKKCNPTQAQL